MQLDRALGGAELCPVMHGKAQVDDGRIDADRLVLEAKFLPARRDGGDRLEQAVEDLLEQFPRTMTIGIGQRERAGTSIPRWALSLATARLRSLAGSRRGPTGRTAC